MPARLSSAATTFIRATFPEQEYNLGHVRRFTTEDEVSIPPGFEKSTYLRMLVCTHEFMDSQQNVEKLLQPLIQTAKGFEIKQKKPKNDEPPPASVFVDLYYDAKVEERTTAKYAPETKQESVEWSNSTGWPLMWRGNVAAIPTAMSERDQAQSLKYLRQVVNAGQNSQFGVATLIVDPERDMLISTATDGRDNKHPLRHSAMIAIDRAARWRRDNPGDEGYLCRAFHVYTTHEPCTMCAMALLHSRITRLIYWKPTPITGGIEPGSSGLCIHAQDKLNWQYEAWKYSGSTEEATEDLGPEIEHIQSVSLGYNV